jgi:ubiquinol-cytochrome c reductase cytochrome c1 subunit
MKLTHLVLAGALTALAGPVLAQGTAAPVAQSWSFSGPFGRLDQAAARRGYQVYAESCANCHSMDFLHYRDLAGIGLSPDQIRASIADITVPAGFDSQGNVVTRPATPASSFRAPFPSEEAARAALNGAYPTDLSLAVKTYPDGPDYLYALLTGYGDPPAGTTLADGMSYNKYFPGHQIAMPQPLSDGQFTYADGTVSTVSQNAHDVVTFLAWAANPEMTQRRHIGFVVALYFLGMAGLTFAWKRRIWSKIH